MPELSTLRLIGRLAVKDFKVGRRYLWLIVPFYIVYGAMFFLTTNVFIFVNALYIFFTAFGLVFLDSRYKSDLLYCSLPMNRSAIVLGRYVNSFLIAILGAGLCFAYGALLYRVFPQARTMFKLSSIIIDIIPFILWTLVALALFYPFYYKLGLGKSAIAFSMTTAVIILLGIGSGTLIRLIRTGNLHGYSSTEIIDGLTNILRATGGLSERIGPLSSYFAASAISAIILTVSAILSIRFYSKRDF